MTQLQGRQSSRDKVASSQLPAPQIAPRTKVVLQSRQFSSSSSPDTPRAKVVLQIRKFSSSSSPDTPRTKVVLQSRQFSASSSTDCSAYYSCTTKSPVLIFQLPRYTPRTKVVLQLRQFSSSSSPDTPRTKVVLQSRQFSSSSSSDTPRTKVVLQSRQFSASSSPDTPRTKVVLESRQRLRFAHSTRTISAEGCAHTGQIAFSPACTISAEGCARTAPIALSPAFRALDTHDLRRGLRGHGTNRTLACISRTRHARSPQRVARGPRGPDKSHSRLHFAHSTRAISAEGCAHIRQIALSPAFRALDTHDLCRGLRAEGCARTGQIALSPAFRALDTHDLRRGLRAHTPNRTLACISRTRHARSPQRVARAQTQSHSRLRFAHSTRAISAEGCAHTTNRTLACISRTRRARSPQRVARTYGKSDSRLHFAHLTRTISAEGCVFG